MSALAQSSSDRSGTARPSAAQAFPASPSFAAAPVSRRATPASAPAVTCFSVVAAADPGTLPRVLEQFAMRSLVPQRWHAVLTEGDELSIDAQVTGLDAQRTEVLASKLRALICVRSVLVVEKGA